MDRFPDLDFSKFNESDVREEFVAPLLRVLGYRSGTENDVIREQSLIYPKVVLGRKKPNDPPLRGKADYICSANGIVQWTIEAKAPGVGINQDSIDQAYTYANHAEVRAVYFVLTDGSNFRVFRTAQGPDATPDLALSYSELQSNLESVRELLLPESLLRDFSSDGRNVRDPVAPGLRSVMRVSGGLIELNEVRVAHTTVPAYNITVVDGALERLETGGMAVYIETVSPMRQMQELNKWLGLQRIELTTDDNELSKDPNSPTVFQSKRHIRIPQGAPLLDLATGRTNPLPMNMSSVGSTLVKGHFEGGKFVGTFVGSYSNSQPPLMNSVVQTGKFHVSPV